jgi:hypothetical protein
MKKYVLSDVHGFYSIMLETLTNAGFFSEPEPPHLIVLGDMLDRGKEAVKMVDFMLRLHDEGRLTYIRGNHEDLLVACLQEVSQGEVFNIASPFSHHFTNGTWDSMLQLSGMDKETAVRYPRELVARVMLSPFYKELLPTTVDYLETEKHIFVHGFIPSRESGRGPFKWYSYDPSWREAGYDGWRSARWYNGMSLSSTFGVKEPGKTIVCGHYHTSYGHSLIKNRCPEWGSNAIFDVYRDEGIIAIDASTANTGRMNCLVIDEVDL